MEKAPTNPVPHDEHHGPVFNIRRDGLTDSLEVSLTHGHRVKAQSDALVWYFGELDIKGKVDGGILKGLGRMFAGETMFFEFIECHSRAAKMVLAPHELAHVSRVDITGDFSYYVRKDGYFCSEEGVTVSASGQSLGKGFFSRQGFIILEIAGKGACFLESYGTVDVIDLEEGQVFHADNGHLVAWTSYTPYEIVRASKGGLIQSWKSGEGLMCRFKGPGRVYVESHQRPPPVPRRR